MFATHIALTEYIALTKPQYIALTKPPSLQLVATHMYIGITKLIYREKAITKLIEREREREREITNRNN